MHLRNIEGIVVEGVLGFVVFLHHDARARRPEEEPVVPSQGLDFAELGTLRVLSDVTYVPVDGKR
jgi:hypothetical protein